jgi:hypothetical protein
MSFTVLPTSIIESGDPITEELWDTYVKDNFDNHESRIVGLEGGSNVVYPPYFWNVTGPYERSVPLVNCGIIRLNFNLTVLAGRLLIGTAGTSGTTQIDFLYKRGANPFTTIFSTKPSVSFASGDYFVSTNGIINFPTLLAGDIIRMDITTTQAGSPRNLLGLLEYEKD